MSEIPKLPEEISQPIPEEPKLPEEISQYMAERLRRENKGEMEKNQENLETVQIEEGTQELMDLTLEKQDLIQSVLSDEKVLAGKGKREKPERIVAGETDFNQVDFRKLGRRFDPARSIEASMTKSRQEIKLAEQRIAELSANKQIIETYQKNIQSKIETIKLARHFDKPIDNYIHTEFIKKATVLKDQIYLTQLFCRFGFFADWDVEQFAIIGLDKKKLDAFRAKKS
jgi:hypothetical protein